MKKNNIIKAAVASASVLTGALALANKLFFNIAFNVNPIWRPHGGASNLPDVSKKGQEWLHANDNHVVTMTNKEGLKLRAHYFPCENAKRTLIEFHGWHGSWDVDFSGSSPYMHEAGCNLLLVEQRAQGQSEGDIMTFGVKEREDVMEWVLWYQENIDFKLPIYLAGLSMGSTTVLMAAADPFPPEVKGIIADCGFTSPYDIIAKVSHQWFKLPKHPVADIFNVYCKVFHHIDLKKNTTIDAVSKTDLPILFVHGTGDNFVPYQMTLAAYDACVSEKDILLAEGAYHGMSFVNDTDAYNEKLLSLFARCEGE